MRRATLINACTKGVLDPNLSERIDLKHYYNSLADAKNILVTPQGGIRRKPGTKMLSDPAFVTTGYTRRLRRRLQPVHVTEAMITAPNGGDKSALFVGGVFTTTTAVGSGTFSVFEVDLGQPLPIVFVDIVNFSASAAANNDCLVVEYYNGSAWVEMEGPGAARGLSARKNIRVTSTRTRRFGGCPGGPTVLARNWRLVVKDAAGIGTVSVSYIRFWTEKNRVSPVRILSFARSSDVTYQLVLTDRNVDVFENHYYRASIPVPVHFEQINEIYIDQQLDTVLLFHEDIRPQKFERQGAADEWHADSVDFTNVPALTRSSAFSGDANEVQDVSVPGLVTGQKLVIWLENNVTVPVTYGGPGTLAAAVKTALAGIIGVAAPGPHVTELTGPDPAFRVNWNGPNGARRWPPCFIVVLDDNAIDPQTVAVERGLNANGSMWGSDNGYPRCGTVVQGRLAIGGFRAAPQTLAFSVVSDLFNFLTTGSPLTADKAIVRTLDTDRLETINAIYLSRHLQFFTDSGEWYIENRVLDATQPVSVVLATRYGIKSSVPLTFADGATLFVQKGGQTLRELLYSDAEQSYNAEPLSLLAPHLLTDTIDACNRNARSATAGNHVFLVQSDGAVVLLTLLRAQEVVAFAPLEFAGPVRAMACDVNSNVWLAVEHAALGQRDLYLEELDDGAWLDAATSYSGAPVNAVGGLYHLAGRTDVWAYADADLIGPLTVSALGALTLPVEAGSISVGLATQTYGRLQTPRTKLTEEQPFRPPGRFTEVEFALENTGQLQVRANDGSWRDVPLMQLGPTRADDSWLSAGGRADYAMLDRLFTGYARVQNLRNWLEHPTMEFRQTVPAPLHIKAIRCEMSHHG